MKKTLLTNLILCTLLGEPVCARMWTNNQGKTIDAEWVRTEGDKVVVKLLNGKEVPIALKILSKEDQDYANKLHVMNFSEKAHIWTLQDGKLLNAQLDVVEAQFISVVDESGKTVKIFMSELSPEDKKFVVNEMKRKGRDTKNGGSEIKETNLSIDDIANTIRRGDIKGVKSYIDQGGDVNAAQGENSLLSIATMENQFPIVKLLTSSGADPNYQDRLRITPLILATNRNNFEIVKFLVASGAQLDNTTEFGSNALMDAVGCNNPQIVKFLIGQGADVLAKNEKDGITPLRIALAMNINPEIRKMLETAIAARKAKILAEGGVVPEEEPTLTLAEITMAIRNGNKALLKKYIAEKGELNIRGNGNYSVPPLCVAANMGLLEMTKILLDGGADIEFPSDSGITPLMYAIKGNKFEIAKLLIARGANINAEDNNGGSVIIEAIATKNVQTIKLILDNGADVITKKDKSGSSPVRYAKEIGVPAAAIKLIETAATIQKEKLRAKGESVPEEGDTPSVGEVSQAIIKGDKATVKKYIDSQGNLNVKDRGGMAILALAAEQNKTEMLKLLLEAGADVNFKSTYSRIPLEFAAMAGRLDNVILLHAAGANLDYIDGSQMTPLHCAIGGNHVEVVKFLLSKGVICKPPAWWEGDIIDFAKKRKAGSKILKLLKETLDKQEKQ